jgi:hypothetical protein
MKKAVLFLCVALAAAATAQTKAPVAGFGGVNWGVSMTEAKKGLKGKIVFEDGKKLIVTRDGEITYRYGFFSKETVKPEEGAASSSKQAQSQPAAEPKFFYAVSEFPYLLLPKLKEKMVAQYGEPTGDNVKKNQGAVMWDSGSGVVIVWVDAYEKKPFCRKISYISKDIAKELNTYQEELFSKKEMEVLKSLVP